jgi:Domain of Unknown Function (DUF928)
LAIGYKAVNNRKSKAKQIVSSMKSHTSYARLLATISALLVIINVTPQVLAENTKKASFDPPRRRDAPRSGTAGGGSRPAIKTTDFTALSPGRQIGLSHSERPTFFVYLPKTTAQTAEFSLFDAQMKGIYQVIIPIENKVGLIGITIPKTAPALVKNQSYHWSLALAYNPNDRTEDWVVGGWVEYNELSKKLSLQLATATPTEQITYYAKHGFWYDAIAKTVELQNQQPNNLSLTQTWAKLLTSIEGVGSGE